MEPIPVVFHIGPLQIHTYGIGLAITFWFAFRYLCRRLRNNGYSDGWMGSTFVWVIVASIVGARIVHVVANWNFYSHNLGDILAIWHGGLSSFGGLALGGLVGAWRAKTSQHEISLIKLLDLVAPVLMAAWALGRLLGPQLMIAGGGRPTDQWYGMYYHGEIGKRIPAPIFQSIESFVVFLILLKLEQYIVKHGGPNGLVIYGMFAFWGAARFFDEFLWLDKNPPFDAVEVAGIVMSAVGFIAMAYLLRKFDPSSKIVNGATSPQGATPRDDATPQGGETTHGANTPEAAEVD